MGYFHNFHKHKGDDIAFLIDDYYYFMRILDIIF